MQIIELGRYVNARNGKERGNLIKAFHEVMICLLLLEVYERAPP